MPTKKILCMFCSALLLVSMTLSLVACGGKTGTSQEKPSQNSQPREVTVQVPGNSRNPASPVIKADKRLLDEAQQKIADHYYELMKERYPAFGEIPREMLDEFVYEGDYLSVSFTFCLGGEPTNYRCEFSTSPLHPEGKWDICGEQYALFAGCALTEADLSAINAMLAQSMKTWAKERYLDGAEPGNLYWSVVDGKLYAFAEAIGDVTEEATETFGCGDHAHIFGEVLVEFSDGKVTLTDLGANGS